MLEAVLREGVLGRAVEREVIRVGLHDLRDPTALTVVVPSMTSRMGAARAWC